MSRYIVLASLDPRGVPSYYIVDTADNSRVRCYDCEMWAEHEARRMNGDREVPEEGRAEWCPMEDVSKYEDDGKKANNKQTLC